MRDKMLNEKEIVFEKVSSGLMQANMLTKYASVGVVRFNNKLIGMM